MRRGNEGLKTLPYRHGSLYRKYRSGDAGWISWRRLSSLLSRDSSRLFRWSTNSPQNKAEMNLGSAGSTACATNISQKIYNWFSHVLESKGASTLAACSARAEAGPRNPIQRSGVTILGSSEHQAIRP